MTSDSLPSFESLTDSGPHARLLSNGRLTALLTSAGTGFTTWGDTLLNAWDGDRIEDRQGWFIYLRDVDSRSSGPPAISRFPASPASMRVV